MLQDKNFLIIFTYAPAGLGHLRVTDALFHGLSKDIKPLILGSHDKTIAFLHQIASTRLVYDFLSKLFKTSDKKYL